MMTKSTVDSAVAESPTEPHQLDRGSSELNDSKDIPLVYENPSPDLAEPEETVTSTSFWPWGKTGRPNQDPDAIATRRSVFDDQELAEYYQPRADYENLHAFDVNARWTYREECKIRRKIDWKILSWILVMFFALNLDRGNLANATADNLLDDLKISTNDYNNAQNMYRVGFLIAEIPSQMIGKKLGPDRWIPVQMILWSLASGGQFFMHNRSGFFACRFFIGLFMVRVVTPVEAR